MKLKAVFFVLIFAVLASAGPVSHFGYLKTCKSGTKGQICGSLTGGTPVMLKGPSLFWSSGTGASFYNRQTVDYFVDYMEIGVIRAAMAIKYNGENTRPLSDDCSSCYGYLSDPSIRPNAKANTKTLVKNVINAAIANDIYVIVDWHSHNANNEKSEAVAFFKEIAGEYPNTPNIIWEIYNEPVSDNASTIKNYANDVISGIRSTGNENLVIVGSNFYSQKPDEQASSGITDSKSNTAYSFHFYSAEHPSSGGINSSANSAMNGGYSVFATEWGSVRADGAGSPGSYEGWITFMDNNNISGCYWNASDVDLNNQTSRIFNAGTKTADLVASTSANYDRFFSPSGAVFKTYMGTKKWTSYAPASTNPRGKDFSVNIEEGGKTWSATDLGLTSGATVKSAEVIDGIGTVTSTSNSVTYTPVDGGTNQIYIRYVVTGGGKDINQRIVVNMTGNNPILPKVDPIDVSHRAPWNIRLASLNGVDPGGAWNTLEFADASVNGGGTVVIKGTAKDTITFTPPASIKDVFEVTPFELTYKMKSTVTGKTSTQTVTLNAQNFTPSIPVVPPPPELGWSLFAAKPNTAPYTFTPGSDKDKDALKILAFYMPEEYPGTLTISPDSTTLTYTPEPNKIGFIRFLAVVTDGRSVSNVGGYRLQLTGSGDQITASATPTAIPGYDPSPIVQPTLRSGSLALQTFGNGKLLVNVAKSGSVSLDIYSISGKKVVTLMSGNQIGSHEFSIANLQKGVYIARLKQGSEVKVQRVVVR